MTTHQGEVRMWGGQWAKEWGLMEVPDWGPKHNEATMQFKALEHPCCRRTSSRGLRWTDDLEDIWHKEVCTRGPPHLSKRKPVEGQGDAALQGISGRLGELGGDLRLLRDGMKPPRAHKDEERRDQERDWAWGRLDSCLEALRAFDLFGAVLRVLEAASLGISAPFAALTAMGGSGRTCQW